MRAPDGDAVPDPTGVAALLPPWLTEATVELGPVSAPPAPTASGLLWSADARSFSLHVPGVARFAAHGGERLTIEPEPHTNGDEIKRHALMLPLAVLCYQRGLVPLHAAAARRDGRTVLIAGDSGAGKSSLLAALAGNGWEPLADELTALTVDTNGRPIAHPAPAEVRLWPDAAQRLTTPARPTPTVQPIPVSAIWWLSVTADPSVHADTIRGLDAVDAVTRLTYNAGVALRLLDRQANLRVAAGAARHVTAVRLRRPRGAWCVPELCAFVDRSTFDLRGVA